LQSALYQPRSSTHRATRLENLVAVHLLRACLYWTDNGYGLFQLHYVRDKEKREVDFLITNKRKPYLLIEAKLSEKEVDRSLPYFQERLRPQYAFQIIGESSKDYLSERGSNLYVASASRFLGALV
jgi:predicted AAA+ superfamily ATPase